MINSGMLQQNGSGFGGFGGFGGLETLILVSDI